MEMKTYKYFVKFWIALFTICTTTIIYNKYALRNPTEKYLFVESSKFDNEKNIGVPVIVPAAGGIGNQLFQFACAYAMAQRRNANVYVEKPSEYVLNENHDHPSNGREFSLNHFKINFSKVVEENFSSFGSGQIFVLKEKHIWEHSLPIDQVLRVNDTCMSEVYFKEYRDEIKEMFTLDIDENPIKEVLDKVKSTESVSVHVRRGDYLLPADNRPIPITFQKKAMKLMDRIVVNATFFVFSDDLEYVRKKFEGFKNVIFVDNSMEKMASLLDFLIMSRCKHNILANSTFSWWSAYLNRNKVKIVIAPSPRHPAGWNEEFYKDEKVLKYRELILNYYLYPTKWLTLNPFEY